MLGHPETLARFTNVKDCYIVGTRKKKMKKISARKDSHTGEVSGLT